MNVNVGDVVYHQNLWIYVTDVAEPPESIFCGYAANVVDVDADFVPQVEITSRRMVSDCRFLSTLLKQPFTVINLAVLE